MDKRFIEEVFPIKEVSEESAREKNIRHGHISTLHIWWARRPLAACRAVVYASLIPYNESYKEEKKSFISVLSKWENSLNMNIIEKAKNDILSNNDSKPPKVLDCFAGGGSIPLEALRLGCEVYAGDYNPVATLILKCTLEYPQRCNNNAITLSNVIQVNNNEKEREREKNKNVINRSLHEDVKKYGKWVLEEAKKEIGKFYPDDPDGSIPIGYIWARTIPCQNPNCNAEIPLMRQYWLAKKDRRRIALYPYVEGKHVKFKIVGSGYEPMPNGFDPSKGSVKRAIATCLVCGSTINDKIIRRLFQQGKAGQRMIAVVLSNKTEDNKTRGKFYRIANEEDLEIFKRAEEYLEKKRQEFFEKLQIDPVPDEPLVRVPVSFGVINVWVYNMNKWADLFNSRQKLALITFVDKVREAYQIMLSEMKEEGYEEEYAKVVVSYLAFIVSRISDTNSVLCHWDGGWEKTATTFARQALPMNWDYIEANIIGNKGYNFKNILDIILLVLGKISNISNLPSKVSQSTATSLPYPDNYFDAVFTDPPYYDNVPYSYLSDFFYVWLKRIVGDLYPDLFLTPLTPKSEEIVAYSHNGGYKEGKKCFEMLLAKAFREIHRVLKPDGIAVIVYAHKSTAGWETLINSLLDSGLVITQAWPIHTEMKSRLRAKESAALASSIFIVARKIERKNIGFYKEIKDELKSYLEARLERLWKEGIAGADFLVSAIGSSIAVFGKYKQIMDDKGNTINTDRLLEDVRRIVTDYAMRQVLHNGFNSEITPLTRFYLLYRWAYKDSKVHFDDARKLAQGIGIDLAEEWNKGFIKKEKEYIQVLGPHERNINSIDKEGSKELIDVLHKALLLWEKEKYDELITLLTDTGYGNKEIFYRVAQAIAESLPDDNKEKRLIQGFLVRKEKYRAESKNIDSKMNYIDYYMQ
ncbi:MAG: DUF1156 domain-containing protein [Candidatus Nitrosocaldaceae archaeon]